MSEDSSNNVLYPRYRDTVFLKLSRYLQENLINLKPYTRVGIYVLALKFHSRLNGPVSGFVGRIPLPSLYSIITRNPKMGANLNFLLGYCLT